MKVVVLYHPNSEHERSILTFQRDFKVRTSHDVELVSLETPEGADKAKAYGISDYPAVLVTDDNGQLQNLWEGEQLPLIDEVNGFIVAGS